MKLWKNNRVSQEYELRTDEIVTGFLASDYAHVAMPLERLLHLYIGNELESTFDSRDEEHGGGRDQFYEVLDAIAAAREEGR